jgi:glutamine synthetase
MPQVKGSAYAETSAVPLSKNLHEAIQKFERSEYSRVLFGNDFVNHFAHTRHWEWKQFQESVTTYERERYFEII